MERALLLPWALPLRALTHPAWIDCLFAEVRDTVCRHSMGARSQRAVPQPCAVLVVSAEKRGERGQRDEGRQCWGRRRRGDWEPVLRIGSSTRPLRAVVWGRWPSPAMWGCDAGAPVLLGAVLLSALRFFSMPNETERRASQQPQQLLAGCAHIQEEGVRLPWLAPGLPSLPPSPFASIPSSPHRTTAHATHDSKLSSYHQASKRPSNHGGRCGDLRLLGGHQPAPLPHHQHLLLQQGDLPPRAHLQLLGACMCCMRARCSCLPASRPVPLVRTPPRPVNPPSSPTDRQPHRTRSTRSATCP